jgi:hypothetical protein
MDSAFGWMAVGIFVGIGLTIFVYVLVSEIRGLPLRPPSDPAVLPLAFQESFGRT